MKSQKKFNNLSFSVSMRLLNMEIGRKLLKCLKLSSRRMNSGEYIRKFIYIGSSTPIHLIVEPFEASLMEPMRNYDNHRKMGDQKTRMRPTGLQNLKSISSFQSLDPLPSNLTVLKSIIIFRTSIELVVTFGSMSNLGC